MTAKELFKGKKAKGSVLLVSKGGYRDNFAYRISQIDDKFHIEVISELNPREYDVDKKPDETRELDKIIEGLENAILYNEYRAREWEEEKKRRRLNGRIVLTDKMLEQLKNLSSEILNKGVTYVCYTDNLLLDDNVSLKAVTVINSNMDMYCNYSEYGTKYPFNKNSFKDVEWERETFIKTEQ